MDQDDSLSPPSSPCVINTSSAPTIQAPEFTAREFAAIAQAAHDLVMRGATHLPLGERALVLYAPTEYTHLLASAALPALHATEGASLYLSQLVHPALSHHQLVLGLHHSELESVRSAVQHQHHQLSSAQQWNASMFDLVSSNQRDSIAMQQYLLEQLDHWRERTPGYIREFLQAYENGHRDWRTSVEQSLNEHASAIQGIAADYHRLVGHINAAHAGFSAHYHAFLLELRTLMNKQWIQERDAFISRKQELERDIEVLRQHQQYRDAQTPSDRFSPATEASI